MPIAIRFRPILPAESTLPIHLAAVVIWRPFYTLEKFQNPKSQFTIPGWKDLEIDENLWSEILIGLRMQKIKNLNTSRFLDARINAKLWTYDYCTTIFLSSKISGDVPKFYFVS